jgi:hypothetical protein
MAQIIAFPGSNERRMADIERALEEGLGGITPHLRECIKNKVSAVISKYPGIPTLSASVVLPVGISESDIQPLINELQREYSEKVMKFAQELIFEICILEARICKLETA